MDADRGMTWRERKRREFVRELAQELAREQRAEEKERERAAPAWAEEMQGRLAAVERREFVRELVWVVLGCLVIVLAPWVLSLVVR